MAQCILVDTDILIDVLRSIEATTVVFQAAEAQAHLCISVVTQMELIVGCRNAKELQDLDSFLKSFEIAALTKIVSNQAVDLIHQYRLSHGLLIPDALIAATAIVSNWPLLTKNQRDYRFIPNLNLFPFAN